MENFFLLVSNILNLFEYEYEEEKKIFYYVDINPH